MAKPLGQVSQVPRTGERISSFLTPCRQSASKFRLSQFLAEIAWVGPEIRNRLPQKEQDWALFVSGWEEHTNTGSGRCHEELVRRAVLPAAGIVFATRHNLSLKKGLGRPGRARSGSAFSLNWITSCRRSGQSRIGHSNDRAWLVKCPNCDEQVCRV